VLPEPKPKLLRRRGTTTLAGCPAALLPVGVFELTEHSRTGLRLGGNLEPLHGSAAAAAGADVDLHTYRNSHAHGRLLPELSRAPPPSNPSNPSAS
jgi:hypothetical protein